MDTYIPDSLIRELEAKFPNRLPTETMYVKGEVTPEYIAFTAGVQHCIRYLKDCAAIQRQSGYDEIKIQ
jgi:hypothetical protein